MWIIMQNPRTSNGLSRYATPHKNIGWFSIISQLFKDIRTYRQIRHTDKLTIVNQNFDEMCILFCNIQRLFTCMKVFKINLWFLYFFFIALCKFSKVVCNIWWQTLLTSLIQTRNNNCSTMWQFGWISTTWVEWPNSIFFPFKVSQIWTVTSPCKQKTDSGSGSLSVAADTEGLVLQSSSSFKSVAMLFPFASSTSRSAVTSSDLLSVSLGCLQSDMGGSAWAAVSSLLSNFLLLKQPSWWQKQKKLGFFEITF